MTGTWCCWDADLGGVVLCAWPEQGQLPPGHGALGWQAGMAARGGLRAGAGLAEAASGEPGSRACRVGLPEEMDCSHCAQPLGRAAARPLAHWRYAHPHVGRVPATLQLPLFLEPALRLEWGLFRDRTGSSHGALSWGGGSAGNPDPGASFGRQAPTRELVHMSSQHQGLGAPGSLGARLVGGVQTDLLAQANV